MQTTNNKLKGAENFPLRTLDLHGAHRGGSAATRALLERGTLPPMEVCLVDPVPSRAAQLSATWSNAGHRAVGVQADAREVSLDRQVDVLGLCTDDVNAQLHLLESSEARLIVMGLIVASTAVDGYGGQVLGFGATVPEHDALTRQSAERLFREVVRLTDGRRVTSHAVSDPVLNNLQVDTVRNLLYQRLAQDAYEFLNEGRAQGSLYVTVASPSGATFPLNLHLRQGRSRAQMQDMAQRQTKEQVLSLRGKQAGIAIHRAAIFVDDTAASAPWLYAVIPSSASFGRSSQFLTVELPSSPAAPLLRQMRQQRLAREAAAKAEEAARQQAAQQTIYATD